MDHVFFHGNKLIPCMHIKHKQRGLHFKRNYFLLGFHKRAFYFKPQNCCISTWRFTECVKDMCRYRFDLGVKDSLFTWEDAYVYRRSIEETKTWVLEYIQLTCLTCDKIKRFLLDHMILCDNMTTWSHDFMLSNDHLVTWFLCGHVI